MEEKLSRREVREGALIILYQTLFGQNPQEITEADEEAFGLARSHETDLIVNGVLSHDEEITGIIGEVQHHQVGSAYFKGEPHYHEDRDL